MTEQQKDLRPEEARPRVLFLTNIPAPYRVAFFEKLGAACDLTVLFERASASNRSAEWTPAPSRSFRKIFLRGLRMRSETALCPGAIPHLLNRHYDILVLGGYSTPTGILSILILRMLNRQFVLSVDGGFAKHDQWPLGPIKRTLLGSAHAYLSPSDAASDYLAHYGVSRDTIYRYPFSSVMIQDITSVPPNLDRKRQLRNELGIAEPRCVVAVGQFIHRKGFDLLISATKTLDPDVGVYIVGDDPTQEYLDLRRALGVPNVHFRGFANDALLRKYYLAADVLALPTRYDIWGLVVNEALAQALPVVTTETCGSGTELITNGVNGYVVPVDDIAALSNALASILNASPESAQRMAFEALRVGRASTIEAMVDAHLQCFRGITGKEFRQEQSR